jgi:DNA-binding NarL/FixJ family response regulator
MITVTIIEDNVAYATSLRVLINQSDGFQCNNIYDNCETTIGEILKEKPDIILMDIELSGKIDGIMGTKLIKEKLPSVNIVMLTIHEDNESIFQSLKNGAVGYLAKNSGMNGLLDGIKEVQNGGSPMSMTIARKVVDSFRKNPCSFLTDRENEVLTLLCQGKSYQAIANNLFIEKTTVKFHLKNIYGKLHVCNKTEAVIKAKENNLF